MESPSPSTEYPPAKRRKTSETDGHPVVHNSQLQQSPSVVATGSSNGLALPGVPKRGARACTACRKGKNRCEGEAPCRRCQLSGAQCIFEKPEKKSPAVINNNSIERVSRLEGQYFVMQSQMIGLQSSLDRILSTLQHAPQTPTYTNGAPRPDVPHHSGSSAAGVSPDSNACHHGPSSRSPTSQGRKFSPLSGFAPPPHKYGMYGTVLSNSPSDGESDDALCETRQRLTNATAAVPLPTARAKRRGWVEPFSPNSFRHVVEKGLVSDAEARELYHIFFSGCHLFIPLFDASYDTYEALKERSPWCFDAILAVASKIRAGDGPPSVTFYKCLEEAQGIARSTLFGPVVRKEAVQAMLLLAAWSTNGWLPCGHALRMGIDLGLHLALERLADSGPKRRSEEEERHLVVSARTWLCIYWLDHQMSLGTGRPILLRDESSIRHCRTLLTHPMTSPSDLRLIAQIELIAQKTHIYETLSPANEKINHATLSFIRRANVALDKWWAESDELHRQTMDDDALLRKILIGDLFHAKLWLVCVALRGVSWDKMPFDQRELAFQAKEAASDCLSTFLNSPAYRAALRYAVHDSLATAAFSGLFLLKVANLFPTEVELPALISQVEQIAGLLSEVAAERYALTLRLMLAILRRKLGLATVTHASQPSAAQPMPTGGSTILVCGAPGPNPTDPAAQAGTMEEYGFVWPAEAGAWSPSNIPLWLQEANLTDLGLPVNGSDGVFLNGPHWAIDMPPMPEVR